MDYSIKIGNSCPKETRDLLAGATTADLFHRLHKEAKNQKLPDLVITIEVAPSKPVTSAATTKKPQQTWAGKPVEQSSIDLVRNALRLTTNILAIPQR
jgi:hypothetical protein